MNKTKKRLLFVLLVTILSSGIATLVLSYFLGKQIVASSTQLVTNEQTQLAHEAIWQAQGFDLARFRQTYTIETLALRSNFDGHTVPADFIYKTERGGNVIIMAHGLGGNRYTNYAMASFFLENGYNVITYDQRSSGENTAANTTFGYWEKYDMIDCIAFAKSVADGGKIAVWGESFGGATAVQALALDDVQDDISFLVLDCPVSSMEWMIAEELRGMDTGLPISYMLWCGNLLNRLELGFSYQDADSASAAKKIHIPTLVINSEADEVTPYFMGKDIYDALASAQKELFTSPDSAHVAIWYDAHTQYTEKLLALMG